MLAGRASFIVILIVVAAALSCATARPMPSAGGCRHPPDRELCLQVATSITDECLRKCVESVCIGGVRIRCGDDLQARCRRQAGLGAFVDDPFGSCEQPAWEIGWCDLPATDNCRAQMAVHEAAHACGWEHGDGLGVPGESGYATCS